VLRHRDDYIKEDLEHLSDTNTYLPLTGDYTNVATSILTGKINQLKNDGLLSPKMAKYYLPPVHPRPGHLWS